MSGLKESAAVHAPLQFLSFWSINDALDLDRLKRQLLEMKTAGLEGVVFHPRYYPNAPAYMGDAYLADVSELILYARSIHMSFWLYDENGWPSGTAGGRVMERQPELTCKWLLRAGDRGRREIVMRERRAPSSFDSEATALFIELTHERYRKGLKPEAFAYVEGFFSDEVAFLDGHGVTLKEGGLPWDDRMPAIYRQAYGEELTAQLPLLFEDGANSEVIRARYWEMATDLLAAGFYRPIQQWCDAHGKRFTAHLKGEEHPLFQLSYSGSCFRMLKEVESPAVDALERYPGNHYYPRIAHSVAVQQGRDYALAEAMGGAGWGITPESFTRYALWLTGHGVNRIVLHLNQFTLHSAAIRDWPPSMPCHLNWKAAFPDLLRRIKEEAAEQPSLRDREPELLIVVPTRGIMASFRPEDTAGMNEHDGSGYPLSSVSGTINANFMQLVEECHAAGIHYEFTEEREAEAGRSEAGALHIGQRAYRRVLISDGCRWLEPAILRHWSRSGVEVLSPAAWRSGMAGSRAEAAGASSMPSLRSPAEPAVPIGSAWTADMPLESQAPAIFAAEGHGCFAAEWRLEEGADIGELELFVHDPVASVEIHGTKLLPHRSGDGYAYAIPERLWQKRASLTLQLKAMSDGEQPPFCFLRGGFAVASETGFADDGDRQLRSIGPFRLTALRQPDATNLIASGYPFHQLPVRLTNAFEWFGEGRVAKQLKLGDVQADAARVRLDDTDLGWCWGPDWSVELPDGLLDGTHWLEVWLYPSTFNTFGPHRHLDGDRHLTSPGQYEGIRNFADCKDAPERTSGDAWHWVRFGMGSMASIVIDPPPENSA